jgi:hypothetical protein
MRAQVVEDADVVIYVAVCDPGGETVTALTQFARGTLGSCPGHCHRRLRAGQDGPLLHVHAVLGLADGMMQPDSNLADSQAGISLISARSMNMMFVRS